MSEQQIDFTQAYPPEDDDEPLYTDEHGTPMLFDVVIPGDYLKAAGVVLPAREPAVAEAPPAPPTPQASVSTEDIEARVRAAIDAALPAATERVAAAMRESLLAELHQKLVDTPAAPRPVPDTTPLPTKLKWRNFREPSDT